MMRYFWESLTKPLLQATKARTIIEIGALSGEHTLPLLDYCMRNLGTLHSVDPAPEFDWESTVKDAGGRFALHKYPSMEVLKDLDAPDAVVIDGDHNWYTVKNELDIVHEHFVEQREKSCLILMHDTSWPYGRRDSYYMPERIPKEYRHDYAKLGVLPGQAEVVLTGGFNPGTNNARFEGGEKNGVLTAVEDFVAEHPDDYELVTFQIVFGYGVLVPKKLFQLYPKLAQILHRDLHLNSQTEALLKTAESALLSEFIAHTTTRRKSQPPALATAPVPAPSEERQPSLRPVLSIVVVVYNMRREAPRTLHSLSAAYQQDINQEDYEVIVVENGSTLPLDDVDVQSLPSNFRYVSIPVENASASPAQAVNEGLKSARGEIFGVLIDGARMATPGLLSHVCRARRLYDRPLIFCSSFLLGDKIQNIAVEEGYDREAEDKLLASINWPEDGYRLFEIGILAGSNSGGWFEPNMESNALFMTKAMWLELDGMDEAFDVPGGGFVNPDLYCRACDLDDSNLVVIAGEATFHQFHGGIATNSTREELKRKSEPWLEQYRTLRGKDFIPPKKNASIMGHVPDQAKRHLESLTRT